MEVVPSSSQDLVSKQPVEDLSIKALENKCNMSGGESDDELQPGQGSVPEASPQRKIKLTGRPARMLKVAKKKGTTEPKLTSAPKKEENKTMTLEKFKKVKRLHPMTRRPMNARDYSNKKKLRKFWPLKNLDIYFGLEKKSGRNKQQPKCLKRCPYCWYATVSPSDLRSHLTNCHGEEVKQDTPLGALRRSTNLSTDGLRVVSEERVMQHFKPVMDLMKLPSDREAVRRIIFGAMAEVMVAVGDETVAPFGYEKEYEKYIRNIFPGNDLSFGTSDDDASSEFDCSSLDQSDSGYDSD